MRISDWSSDVCSSDLVGDRIIVARQPRGLAQSLVEYHHQPVDLARIALDRIGMPLLRIMGEMRLLPEHRADARDLEHQPLPADRALYRIGRSEEHTSELQSLMRSSYAVFCLKK